MLLPLSNTPRDYAWGSRTGIADALGTEPSGGPEAELWLGAHPGSPARIEGAPAGAPQTLDAWIAADPAIALGGVDGTTDPVTGEPRLPFLLKILAAGGPLSLQAHPSSATARRRFAEEDAAGIPRDAADRNYKDPFHKPELLFALSETFDALCGFRSVEETRALLGDLVQRGSASGADTAALAELAALLDGEAGEALRRTVGWLLADGDRERVGALVDLVVTIAGEAEDGEYALEYATVRDLDRSYPRDPGIVLSLLLNRVRLNRGEALYLPAGNIHAYLLGTGVELMAASDNVLRGGLTPKHIDVPELLDVLEFTPLPVPYLRPEDLPGGARVYRPDVPDFALVVVDRDGSADAPTPVVLSGPAIAVATEGALEISGERSRSVLERGASLYITPDEGALAVSGRGTLFIATV